MRLLDALNVCKIFQFFGRETADEDGEYDVLLFGIDE